MIVAGVAPNDITCNALFSGLLAQNEVLLAKVDGLAAKVDGLAAKSAQQEKVFTQQEWLIAHLERFKAQVLEENEELRGLLLAKEG